MDIPIYQVDAFTDRPFAGNPAAVCPLREWLDDKVMGLIAFENNLSETAFFVPRNNGDYDLRWFTPAAEVDLCGHATLATAHVVFTELAPDRHEVVFHTRSGRLVVRRREDDPGLLEMDLPADPPAPCQPHPGLAAALGRKPEHILATAGDYVAVYGSEDEVAALAPDMPGLRGLDRQGVCATAPGRSSDFVTRYFTPAIGIDEDPVTGAAHCILVPYWAARLGRKTLRARQISRRGGTLLCEDRNGRVAIAGRAAPFLSGTIHL